MSYVCSLNYTPIPPRPALPHYRPISKERRTMPQTPSYYFVQRLYAMVLSHELLQKNH